MGVDGSESLIQNEFDIMCSLLFKIDLVYAVDVLKLVLLCL